VDKLVSLEIPEQIIIDKLQVDQNMVRREAQVLIREQISKLEILALQIKMKVGHEMVDPENLEVVKEVKRGKFYYTPIK
jgi:hypothetical protein